MELQNKVKYISEVEPKLPAKLFCYDNKQQTFAVRFEGKDGGVITCYYHTLAELNEEWEDYKSAEPLIKDEKIRKAVRAWAEANGYDFDRTILEYTDYYDTPSSSFSTVNNHDDNGIHFNYKLEGARDGKDYTIAELCGEEE